MIGVVLALVVHLLAPLVIVVWVGVARAMSRTEAVLMTLIGAAAVMFAWLAGPVWIWIGRFWPGVLAVLLVGAVMRLAARTSSRPWRPQRGLRDPRVLMAIVVFAALVVENEQALAGRVTAEPAVALEWPLRGGSFTVLHGGSTAVLNHHHGVPAQNFALDVVAVNRLGIRARGLMPDQLDRYRIFGMPVHAPCAGEVIATRDGIADGTTPTANLSLAAGNYAAVYCGNDTILLAHFEAGTLAVKPGARVRTGDVIGRVGSSGNSSEPHLHIQADAGRVADPLTMITTAHGVPMTFAGRFLVRNDVVTR
jgi:hypothetical protein